MILLKQHIEYVLNMDELKEELYILVFRSFLLDESQKKVLFNNISDISNQDELSRLKEIFGNEKEFLQNFYKHMLKNDALNIPINDLK